MLNLFDVQNITLLQNIYLHFSFHLCLHNFDKAVAAYDMSNKYFSLDNMDDFCWQVRRTLAADYESNPIILDDYGQVADGNHRLCHAIIDGVATVKAYRLLSMPEPDFVELEK